MPYQGRKVVPRRKWGCSQGVASRTQNSTYLVTDIKKFTQFKWSYFVYDPPIFIEDPKDWNLCPQGLTFRKDTNGIYHVLDWIGGDYPNASDILMEIADAFGTAKLSGNEPLHLLTPGKSNRLLVHPAGYLLNEDAGKLRSMYAGLGSIPECFLEEGEYKQAHLDPDANMMCAALHWQHVNGGIAVPDSRYVSRMIGDTTYSAVALPKGMKVQTGLAIIGWMPITEFHIVNDSPDETPIQSALKKLGKLTYPTYQTNT